MAWTPKKGLKALAYLLGFILVDFSGALNSVWSLFSDRPPSIFIQEHMTVCLIFSSLGFIAIVFLFFNQSFRFSKKKKREFDWTPWIFVALLTTVIFWKNFHYGPIPAASAEYQEILKSCNGNGDELCRRGEDAFDAGNYAYSIMFYEEARKQKEPPVRWGSHTPIYLAARLKLNPTSAGYAEFEKGLNDMIEHTRFLFPKGIGGQGEYMNCLTMRLSKIRKMLPRSTRDKLDDAIEQIHAIPISD